MGKAPAPLSASLPRPLNSLIGRASEVRAVAGLLQAHRLVSLVGAAGCGKTRLAVAVAASVETSMEPPVAVSFVDLSAADGDATALANAALDALGLERRPDRGAVDTFAAGIAHGLLVLDNCEHVAASVADLISRLLAADSADGCRILVTSRQPLDLADEAVWRVEPLTGDPALELFRARVFERSGSAMPTAYEADAAQICAALDGLPLAIELAAARAALLSVPEVHRLLTDRFRVLADAKAAGPAHHRTLRATLDWSYQLLDDAERALLCQLSVFRGGWRPEALAALPAWREDVAASLAAKSLVLDEVHTGRSRQRMLQTVAAYAAARLAEHPDEAAAARAAHAAHFVDLAERGQTGLRGPEMADWLRALTVEHDNLRAAMAWLAERPDTHDDLRLAAALTGFHHLTGHYSQGRRWLTEALDRRPDAPVRHRVAAYSGAASLAMLECDYAVAADLAARGLEHGPTSEYGRLCALLGSVERERARYTISYRHLDAARAFFRRNGDAWGEARVVQMTGYTAWLGGDLAHAAELVGESIRLFGDKHDPESNASNQMHLGAIALYQGSDVMARRFLTKAHKQYTELQFPEGVAWALDLLARVDLRTDGAEGAAGSRLRESLAIHRRLGDRWRAASVLEALAEWLRLSGAPVRAAALLGAADAVRAVTGAPTPTCERPDRDRTAAGLVAELGEDRFAAAVDRGRDAPLDDLLADAFSNAATAAATAAEPASAQASV